MFHLREKDAKVTLCGLDCSKGEHYVSPGFVDGGLCCQECIGESLATDDPNFTVQVWKFEDE